MKIPAQVTSENGKVTGNIQTKIWEKDGQKRVYLTIRFNDGSKVDAGYVQGDQYIWSGKGLVKDWCRKVEAAMFA